MPPSDSHISSLLDMDATVAARQVWVEGIASGLSEGEADRAAQDAKAMTGRGIRVTAPWSRCEGPIGAKVGSLPAREGLRGL